MRFSSFACGCLCVAVAVLILAPRSGLLAPWAGDAAAQIAPSFDDSDADVAVGKNEAPIVAARGALYVGAVLDQTVKARFIVDSGATDVSISPEVARRPSADALRRAGPESPAPTSTAARLSNVAKTSSKGSKSTAVLDARPYVVPVAVARPGVGPFAS